MRRKDSKVSSRNVLDDNHRIGLAAYREGLPPSNWESSQGLFISLLSSSAAIAALEYKFNDTCTGYKRASYTLETGRVLDSLTHHKNLLSLTKTGYSGAYTEMTRTGTFEVNCRDDYFYRETKSAIDLLLQNREYEDSQKVRVMSDPNTSVEDYEAALSQFEHEEKAPKKFHIPDKQFDSRRNFGGIRLASAIENRLMLLKRYMEDHNSP